MNDQINEENMSTGLRTFYITVEKTYYRAPKNPEPNPAPTQNRSELWTVTSECLGEGVAAV